MTSALDLPHLLGLRRGALRVHRMEGSGRRVHRLDLAAIPATPQCHQLLVLVHAVACLRPIQPRIQEAAPLLVQTQQHDRHHLLELIHAVVQRRHIQPRTRILEPALLLVLAQLDGWGVARVKDISVLNELDLNLRCNII